MQSQVDPTNEKRGGGHRARMLKGGRIVFNAGFSAMDCTVRNLSEGGARLQFGTTQGIPNTFDLYITGNTGETKHACVVRWRTPVAIGVEFTPATA